MGWVATNTTPYRIAMGKPAGKYIAARAIHEANGWQKPAEPLPRITKVDFEDRVLPKDAEFHMLLNNRENILSALDNYGVAVLRGHFHKRVGEKFDEEKKKTKLSNTKGDGVAGKDEADMSYYTDLKSKTWNGEQTMFLSFFAVLGNDLKHTILTRKAIVLRYKEGSENFAHRDGLDDDEAFPYQGTVMVSKPGVDFTGGEFYVASKNADGGIVRTIVEFKSPGDLVLFRAEKTGGFEHGMLPVRKGSSSICERVAIGLFQKK